MKSTSKTLVLAVAFAIGLTTALAAMVNSGGTDGAAPKSDRLSAPIVSAEGYATVEPGDGNITIATRPAL